MAQLTETQKEFCAGKAWKMTMHLNCEDQGILQHRCEDLKINRIVRTPKVKGQWGTGVASYWRDGDEAEYASVPELLVAMGIQ